MVQSQYTWANLLQHRAKQTNTHCIPSRSRSSRATFTCCSGDLHDLSWPCTETTQSATSAFPQAEALKMDLWDTRWTKAGS